ncbi:MAG: M56 family metallopeptidase [Chlorobi bacterium]|nr:M56 family metallopeptidase [Chlorobiota bacterium]
MTNFLYYSSEVAISMFLFFAVWKIFLQKETFNKLQRIFLLASFILSFILPLVNINLQTINQTDFLYQITETIQLNDIIVKPKSNSFFPIQLSEILYSSISLILLLRFLFKLISIIKFKNKCELRIFNGTKVYVCNEQISPFSFINYIFFNKEDIHKANFENILQHELAHTKQKHSLDILLSEIAIIFMWFNPMIYIYKSYLKMLHEYLSDEKVILQGFEADKYKMLLIKQQVGQQFEFANHFNKSLTLKRINMINKLKSKKIAKLKVLLIIPLIGLMTVLFSFSNNKKITNKKESFSVNDTIFVYVKNMPEFPGGNIELRRYLATRTVYPVVAKKNGIEGTVFVRFEITKTGKVGKIELQKGVNPLLDDEAVRVIKTLPKFKPGEQNGKKVNVWFSIPVTFKLSKKIDKF